MRTSWRRVSLVSLWAIALILCSIWFIDRYSIPRLRGQVEVLQPYQSAVLRRTEIAFNHSRSTDTIGSKRCLANIQQHEYAAAVTNCKQAIENDASNLEAYLNLGLAYYHLEDYPQAIAQYQYVIRQNPRDYRAFYNWGLVNSARGEYQQAIDRYHLALNQTEDKFKTQQALIFNDLGAALIMLRQYDPAIANLERAIELDSGGIASYFNRGCAHHHQGNYQAGIDDFSQVITMNANYTEAYISRAILNHLLRHEKAAYSDLEMALQQYQERGDRMSYQKIMGLKNSMVTSRVQQTG